MEILLPPLPTGDHIVMWTFSVTGFWDVVAELQVDGAARFRKINSNQGDSIPVNAIWCFVEITG